MSSSRRRVVIIGALGMDFHTFNTVFRNDGTYEVVAFTMAGEQNMGTTEIASGLLYPPDLSGKLYPNGVPIIPESSLEQFIKDNQVDEAVFAYSDISHENVMHKASRVLAAGADFRFVSGQSTMIQAQKPLIAICSIRTGCGKSQVSRVAARYFRDQNLRVVAIREPMPYGNLIKQNCMRFETYEDLNKYKCTVEEREEYEPYLEQGLVIYSGVDYEMIIREAEKEADVIVWDGGNNEICFYKPDMLLVVTDPLRPGHELKYHPGEVNLRKADVVILNKVNSVKNQADIDTVVANITAVNKDAPLLWTDSVVSVEDPEQFRGKKVVVVEDGPTVTHGDMDYGAGMVAAKAYGAEPICPKPYLVGGMKSVFAEFPHLERIVPAMGYTDQQRKDLEATLNACECDVILNGSPIHLAKLVSCNKPIVRVQYDVKVHGDGPSLEDKFKEFHEKFIK